MWDSHYRDIRSKNPFVWPDVQVIRLISKSKLETNSNVLDLGCGEGRNIRLLSESGYNVTAVDQSKHALEIVKTLYSIESKKLICSDAVEALANFKNESFDLILCWGLMHYLTDTNIALNEINRVLKKGAKTVLSFSSYNEKRETIDSVKKYFSQKEVEDSIASAELKIVDIGLIENNFIKDHKVESYYWVLAEKS